MITATEIATEKGTIAFDISFTDEDDIAVTPETIEWSLIDFSTTVINDRDNVEVETPASTITIVLSGDDLQILSNERFQNKVNRYLVIEATYNSDLGNGLAITDTIRFKIENLRGIL